MSDDRDVLVPRPLVVFCTACDAPFSIPLCRRAHPLVCPACAKLEDDL